jgi:predicted ATPase
VRVTGLLSVLDGENSVAVGGDGSADVVVGRGRELAPITAAMTSVRRRVQRAVHLVGEPGIGKTALAEHVSSLASAQGWAVVWGRAWDAGGMPPYWPWQQALGSLVRTTTAATRCDPGTLALLVDLVPKLADAAGPAPAPAADPGQARAALHRAVVQILASATSEQPLLVVLDDLHEADAASQVLTGVVCRSLPNNPLLVLSTQRPVPQPAPGQDTLEALTRRGTVIPVGPLDRSAVSAQATALTRRECTADEGEWLYLASGGNPFFVEQLVRWSQTGGLRPPGTLAVSAAVHQVVSERLAVLDVDTRRVITVAAVAGEDVEEQVLAAVTGLPAYSFTGAVEQAVGTGIL